MRTWIVVILCLLSLTVDAQMRRRRVLNSGTVATTYNGGSCYQTASGTTTRVAIYLPPNAGSNRASVVMIVPDGPYCTGVAQKSNSAAYKRDTVTTDGFYVWHLVGSSASADSAICTFSSGMDCTAIAVNYYNVHQTTPISGLIRAYVTATSGQVTVSSSTNSRVLFMQFSQNGETARAVNGTGEVMQFSGDTETNGERGCLGDSPGASAVVGGFSWTTSAYSVVLGLSLNHP